MESSHPNCRREMEPKKLSGASGPRVAAAERQSLLTGGPEGGEPGWAVKSLK